MSKYNDKAIEKVIKDICVDLFCPGDIDLNNGHCVRRRNLQ